MSLSILMRGDFQKDLGISTDEAVFTNDELDRLFTRSGEIYPLAVYYGYLQLLASANKFRDYTEGMSSEKLSQVRDHLANTLEIWRDEARGSGNQLASLGLVGIPTREKERPWRTRRRNNDPDMEWPD